MYVRTPLYVCCLCFRSLQEELRSVEESKRQQIYLLKKQEEDCSMYFREKRAMEGRCRDLSKQKETISTETRVSLSCSTLHTYVHTYMHTYVHTYACTYICTYIHTYVHMYIHTYVHTYIHTYVHMYVHTYVRTYIHTYVHTYACTYICTYIRTYVCTYPFV